MGSRSGFRRILYKARRALLMDDPHYYDMYENPGEQQLGKLYLNHIQETILSQRLGAPLAILDAGCQAGRMSIPLAHDGHQVTGVDTSGVGLRRAARHARENGVRLKLIRANLTRWLPAQPDGRFDVVVCAEVLYLRENYRQLLAHLVRMVKTGGLLFVSHRPSGYYLVESFGHRHLESIRTLLARPEGMVLGSYYNWQDADGLQALYQNFPVEILKIVQIGNLNPLPRMEELSGAEKALLEQAVKERRFTDSGRYLLVCAKKC